MINLIKKWIQKRNIQKEMNLLFTKKMEEVRYNLAVYGVHVDLGGEDITKNYLSMR